MFKVQKEEFVNKTFRLKKSLVDELYKFANENGVSLNELVSQCCRYALDNALIDNDLNERSEPKN